LTRRNNAETKQTKDLVEPKNQHFETTLGYSLVKQFYSPDYGDPKPEHSIEDHRNTIYWSGTVRTDESGRATVIFYNTDDAAQIRIFTEGYNAAGKTGVASSLYKVE
jgi:uncharacterized protein YfaS (alpha-2-macroglobulin family)